MTRPLIRGNVDELEARRALDEMSCSSILSLDVTLNVIVISCLSGRRGRLCSTKQISMNTRKHISYLRYTNKHIATQWASQVTVQYTKNETGKESALCTRTRGNDRNETRGREQDTEHRRNDDEIVFLRNTESSAETARVHQLDTNCPSPASDDTIPLTKRDGSGRAALGGKNRSCARTDGTEPMQFAIPLS